MDFYKDLIYIVFTYLPIDDILKIQYIYNYDLEHLLKKLYVSRILDRLYQLGLGQEFIDSLIESKAVISGSFILQSLLGEYWDNSDLDIYQVTHYWTIKNTKIKQRGFSPIEDYLWKENGSKDDKFSYDNYSHLGDVGINIVRMYIMDKVKIQVINIDTYDDMVEQYKKYNREIDDNVKKYPSTLEDFINNSFDFKFCMNIFNGKELQIHDKCNMMYRESINRSIKMYQYENKESWIPDKDDDLITHYRCFKYLDRGFKIQNYVIPDTIYVRLYESRYSTKERKYYRVDKYVQGDYLLYGNALELIKKYTNIKYYNGDDIFSDPQGMHKIDK